jgi:hypothetical protein
MKGSRRRYFLKATAILDGGGAVADHILGELSISSTRR